MRSINWLIITAFFLTTIIGPAPELCAQTSVVLPIPGSMVNLSRPYDPLQLRGIQVFPKEPLRFDFLIDKGESGLRGQLLKDEITRLTKYFLTCLTVPETDLWVNLSPYEKNRIEPYNFGITQMGRDLLEQDYLLKQVTASLSYPDSDLGRRFWHKLYEKAYALYGTTDIPVNTFNKVWIVPKSADVYVHGTSAFVADSELDVMLDIDYLALKKNLGRQDNDQYSQIYTQVMREMILPVLRKEVNGAKNFAVVRQVFDAMILATWYKRHLKNGFLGKEYVGKNKVRGVDLDDKNSREEIFQQYLKAFKKKVYNYIKEDHDPLTQKTLARKYVSGGLDFTKFDRPENYNEGAQRNQVKLGNDLAMATVDMSLLNKGAGRQDPAMFSNIGKIMRNIFLPLVIVLGVAGVAHAQQVTPNAGRNAVYARITPNADGKTVHVTVKKGDTLGAIVLKVDGKAAPLWGPQGAVAKAAQFANLKDPGVILIGEEFNIPAAEFKEAQEIVNDALNNIPATPTAIAPPENPLPVVQVPPQLVPVLQPAIAIPPAAPENNTGTAQNSMTLAQAIGHSKSETETVVNLDVSLQDAQQDVSNAGDKGTVRLYFEGGNETNPELRYIGPAVEIRTPALTHPSKAHDARQGPIDDGLAKAAKEIQVRGNAFDLITAVKKYAAIDAHLNRLESITLPGLADEIAQAQEDRRHQLAVITSSLVIPLKDLPAGSNIDITDAQVDIGHVEATLQEQGVPGQPPQAEQAGFTLASAMEGVRGNQEISERSRIKKITPSHLTVHANPTIGSAGGGLVGWLIAFVTPEWKTYPSFDARAQAKAIKEAAAVWQDARLSIYRQLKQTLLDLRDDQNNLEAAKKAWDNRGNETDPEKLAEMSANIRELEVKVTSGQLAAMNMGTPAALVENAVASTEEDLNRDAKELVQGAFEQGVEDMKAQAQEWKDKLEADHKDKKNVPAVLEAVNSITASMKEPLKDEDVTGLPVTDATGGVTVGGASFTIGLPSPIAAHTSGLSSNSPDAPTFITGINEGGTLSPVFKKGGNKETKDWETQMNSAQEQYVLAQQGQGEGPKEFRQAIYGYLTASIAQKIVADGGEGFNFTSMIAYYRSNTSYDSYSVFSVTQYDPVHLAVKGISKLLHRNPQEEASVITARALTEEYKMQAKDDMYTAMSDPAKGPRWQAWDSFLNGKAPFITNTDSKGKVYNEFNGLLEALRREFKPLWAAGGGPPPDDEPLDIRIMRLHLKTAEEMLSYGPDAVAYWTAPVVVRVGSITGKMYWQGIRGGVTIDLADKKRAQLDAEMQIAQLKQELDRIAAQWKRGQAGEQAKAAAAKAVENILSRQAEERPLIVEAPQAQWTQIANAVAAAQPINRELAEVNKQGKDPRTIAINILASIQLHPEIATEMLGGISKDLIDWVRRARIEEVNAWIEQLQHQEQVDDIIAARRVMEFFAQQQFALEAFEKADLDLKAKLDKDAQELERAKTRYLSARSQLEESSRQLKLAISALNEEQRTGYGIEYVRWATAPTPSKEESGIGIGSLVSQSIHEWEQHYLTPSPVGIVPRNAVNPGGVDMNSRFLNLKEHADGNNVSVIDDKALQLISIDGVSPRVLQLVAVTPGMLRALLGEVPG